MTDVQDHDDPASIQVLTNADLLHCIFTFVPLLPKSHLDSYMARCAIVYRAFYEPAIRILWRDLNIGLLPLWHLLSPPNTPFPSPNGGNNEPLLNYFQVINSAQLYLDSTQWDRFLWHAAHIRIISYATLIPQRMEIHDAHCRLIQSVIAHNGGNAVLPLLRTIDWRGRYTGDDTLIPFLTSTLRDVTIDFKGFDERQHISLLRKVREASPLLERVGILLAGDNLVMGSSPTIRELLTFPQLRWMKLSRISGLEAFQALATMPTLTSLNILEVTGPWARVGQTISVQSLQELSVAGDILALQGLFDGVHFQALRSAIIRFSYHRNIRVAPANITAFFSLFYNAVSNSGLHILHVANVSRRFPFSISQRDLPALVDLVAPILPTRDLHTFSLLSVNPVMTVDDADVEALATAWPNLERLVIDRGPTPESSVSFRALHYLRRHCPRLQELSTTRLRWPFIGVHALPSASSGIDGLCLPPHPLRRLTMQSAYLPKTIIKKSLGPALSDEDVEAMAEYLLDLFPRLEPEQYRRAAQEEGDSSSASELSRKMESVLRFDGRWRRVSARVYTLCRTRDGL